MKAQPEDQIVALAGHLHAATARFVDLAAQFDEAERWSGMGMRSGAHWLTINTGIDLWNAREILRAGRALRRLPLLHEAFAAGSLSFDKVRLLTLVATADDEAIWLQLAREASGAQLARICREYRRSIAVDDPERAALQRARRRLVCWWLDQDGLLALSATLPPEEGRLVLNAIESAVLRPAAAVAELAGEDPCAEGEADHPQGARRADALVRICRGWLAASAAAPPGSAPAELVVHVDLDTLTGADTGGRCHLEDGPAIAVAAARRIGCDASVLAVLERGGVPLDVGRARRVVSGRQRRLLQLRDRGCRYPGCGVPAADTEGHHLVAWPDQGRTDLDNLLSLCRFHHHRHHEGAFRIVAGPDRAARRRGEVRFETGDGRPIAVRATGVAQVAARGMGWLGDTARVAGAAVAPATPRAGGGGASFDLDHTIVVVAGNLANAAARRSAEQPSGP
ncbi:MAG: DUF222 domain-containing protein [Candidatus Dormibacteria bacterium]